ncbi:hypothetical protein GCM10028862_21500 [Luteimonas pelagia]
MTAARERGSAPRHDALRTATREAHARVDALFPDGLRDAADYRAYLRGMHRFTGDMSAGFQLRAGREGGGRAARVGDACAAACGLLAADLVAVGAAPLPARGAAPAIGDALRQLGWEYVFAGSAFGARRLLRDVRALGHASARAARFLDAHAAGDGWHALLARIEDVAAGDAERSLHRGAREAFAHAGTCLLRARDEDLHGPARATETDPTE